MHRFIHSILMTCVGTMSGVSNADEPIALRLIADTYVEGGLEIVGYDAQHDRLHAIGLHGRYVLDFDDENRAGILSTSVFSTTQHWDATSLAIDPVGRGFAAVSWIPSPPDSMPGVVQIIDLASGDPVWQFNIGYHPDCVMFSPDGSALYAANEGEPHTTNHKGAITIADLDGIEAPSDFAGFNTIRTYPIDDPYLAEGVDVSVLRVKPEHAEHPGVDIEPEYIAPTPDGAWVSLQENNGLAFFDLASRQWTMVRSMGTLSFPFDVSDDDGFRLYPGDGFGLLPLPDTIVMYEALGRSFIVSANEGEKLDGHEIRLGDAIDEGLIDPALVERLHASIGDLSERGADRVYISTIDGDGDGDGDIDRLCVQGGRSVSIIDAASGVTVWNSGPQIELITGMEFPELYNAGDTRSDRAGPEPEGIAIHTHDGRTLMAVGLERTNAIMLYDITLPYSPVFLDAIALSEGCAGPEGMAMFERNGRLLLAVASEKGGCLSIFEIG